ncbi:surface-anchored protein [Corynebacterium renale]|uniref:SpaA isopeptide-forming pilin-related protein n=1 Tax=Corynebacterium renale TaxID=1724 RepID=UPI000DA33B23|nr:SpaA isopeptide-forming pilin-related protein [Corynebacterium renale]SQG63483.1 surface-anchored protein [Corynebacterium renale]STD00338.1 surface-anchored protein [Corynebacterium renale]
MRKVAALAMVGVFALSTPLADAQVVTGNDRGLNAVAVDKHKAISLTVRKIAPNPNDDVLEGHLPPGPIGGAKFRLAQVRGIDVTTEAGREQAKRTDVDQARALGFGNVQVETTNDAGYAYFTDLEPGLYLLEEQHRADGVHEFAITAPKLVLLPLGDVTGTQFTYDGVVVTKKSPDTTTTPPTTPPSTVTTTPPPETTTVTTPPETTPPTVTTTPDRDRTGGLPETGANVLWAAGLGALLVVVGIFMARRRTEKNA